MTAISVKAILCDSAGRVLFAKNPRGEYELPGGRPEAGEDLEAAIIREVHEECRMAVVGLRYVGSRSSEVVPGKYVLLVFFRCSHDGQTPVLSEEHTQFAWINPGAERPSDVPDFYWDAVNAMPRPPASTTSLAKPLTPSETKPGRFQSSSATPLTRSKVNIEKTSWGVW